MVWEKVPLREKGGELGCSSGQKSLAKGVQKEIPFQSWQCSSENARASGILLGARGQGGGVVWLLSNHKMTGTNFLYILEGTKQSHWQQGQYLSLKFILNKYIWLNKMIWLKLTDWYIAPESIQNNTAVRQSPSPGIAGLLWTRSPYGHSALSHGPEYSQHAKKKKKKQGARLVMNNG